MLTASTGPRDLDYVKESIDLGGHTRVEVIHWSSGVRWYILVRDFTYQHIRAVCIW
jgi:hypothetical protein